MHQNWPSNSTTSDASLFPKHKTLSKLAPYEPVGSYQYLAQTFLFDTEEQNEVLYERGNDWIENRADYRIIEEVWRDGRVELKLEKGEEGFVDNITKSLN